MKKKAIVLLSGGLDSATVLALIASKRMYDIFTMSFSYGQRSHNQEITLASKLSEIYTVAEHKIVQINPNHFISSALVNYEIPVPEEKISNDVPITYVPARNTVFLSYAFAWSEVINAHEIYIGANQLDYSNYPDCRSEYIKAMQNVFSIAKTNKNPLAIEAPLIDMTKKEIIELGLSLDLDYSNTISCYQPNDYIACGTCESCLLRLRGFQQNNYQDPVCYK